MLNSRREIRLLEHILADFKQIEDGLWLFNLWPKSHNATMCILHLHQIKYVCAHHRRVCHPNKLYVIKRWGWKSLVVSKLIYGQGSLEMYAGQTEIYAQSIWQCHKAKLFGAFTVEHWPRGPGSRLPRFIKYPDVDVYNQQRYCSSMTFIILVPFDNY